MSPVPDTIGPYKIIRHLGSGGMSAVYLALDTRLERHVALKILHTTLDSPENRNRILREARLAGSLSHRNIVTIYAVDDYEGLPYIVMEYVVGETLAALIHSKAALGIVRRIDLIDEVCAGLMYAWRKLGLVHRDIKPSNLMLDRHDVLRILDFGIARAAEAGAVSGTRIAGTPAYMAPEQIEGRPVDHRCDIFAVGVVLYEVLTYRRAFHADSQAAVFERVLHHDPVPLLDCNPDLDPELARIVERAIRKNPDERYADLKAMRDDLARVRERLLQAQLTDTTVLPAEPPAMPAAAPAGRQGVEASLREGRATRIREFLEAARSAFGAGDLQAAVQQAEEVLTYDPHHAEALTLLDRATRQLESRRAGGWLEQARKHLAAGELALAAELVQQARQRGASRADTDALATDIETARQTAREADERRAAAQAGLEEARQALAAGDEARAIAAAERVLAIDAGQADARELRSQAAAALATRRRDERHGRLAEEAVASARELANQGATDLAVEMLAVFRPPHPHVLSALAELRAVAAERAREETDRRARELRVQQLLATARAAIQGSRWSEALDAASGALANDPHDAEALQLREQAYRQVAAERERAETERRVQRLLEDARARMAVGALDDALAMVSAFEIAHEEVERLRLELTGRVGERSRQEAARAAAARHEQEQAERREQAREERRARHAVARARELALEGALARAIAQLEVYSPPHPLVTTCLDELRAHYAAEQQAREDAEQKARLEAERRAHEEAARDEARRHATAEAERRAGVGAERRAKEETARHRRPELEEERRHEAEHKAGEEAERQSRDEAARRARLDAQQRAHDEAERRAKEETARLMRTELEQKGREEAARKAREEPEQRAREESERRAKQEEAERRAKEEAERRAREQAQQQARADAERRARAEADRSRAEGERGRQEDVGRSHHGLRPLDVELPRSLDTSGNLDIDLLHGAAATDSHLDVQLARELGGEPRAIPRHSGSLAVVLPMAIVALIVVSVVWWGVGSRRPQPPASNPSGPVSAPAPGEAEPPEPALPESKPPATLIHVESEPSGATVSFDGSAGTWTTPADVPVPPGATARLRVTRAGYGPQVRVLSADEAKAGTVRIVLRPVPNPPVTVSLSGPFAFEVLDGRRVVSAAAEAHRFTLPEPRALRLRAPALFLNRTITVAAQPGQAFEYRVPEPGTLSVRTTPALERCRVTVDGADLDDPPFPPISRRELAAGDYVVVLTCPDGERRLQRVTITPGESETVTIR